MCSDLDGAVAVRVVFYKVSALPREFHVKNPVDAVIFFGDLAGYISVRY